MLNNPLLMIDTKQLEDISKALPYTPTVSSWHPNKNDVFVLHYQQLPAHELPDYYAAHHVLPLYSRPVHIEARLDDQLRQRSLFECGSSGLIPAGTQHWAVWDQAIDLSIIFLHPQFLKSVAQEVIKGDRVELIPQHKFNDPALYNLGMALKADAEEGYSMGCLYTESVATALAIRLAKNHTVRHASSKTYKDGLSQQQLQQVTDYIHDHLDQDIKLAHLAQLVGLSQYYLCHLFKQSMGIAPHQYVIQQRVERAKWLLQHRDMSIAEIAARCGFASQSHLNRHFGRLVGVTPKAARQLSKNMQIENDKNV